MEVRRTTESLKKRVRGEDVRTRSWRLKGFNIPEYNQKTILEYDDLLSAKGKKDITRSKYILTLCYLSSRMRKPFKKMTEQDLIKFVSWIEHNPRFKSPSTKNRYKQCLLTFMRWIHKLKKGKTPDCLDFLEFSVEKPRNIEDVLTWEDINKMIKVADNPRDRALIVTLFESGVRRGEIISCAIKHLQFFPEYAVLTVPSESVSRTGVAKTGTYTVTLIDAVPYLKAYLNHHPKKGNPNAPLFVALSYKHFGKPLEGHGLYLITKRLSKRAKLKKQVYTHLFRHSQGTRMAREGYTATEINIAQGRRPGSRISQTYIHMNGGDVRKKMLQRRGIIKPDDEKRISPPEKIICWSCGEENPSENSICFNDNCNMPLRVKADQKERFERVGEGTMIAKTLGSLKDKEPKAYKELIGAILKIAKVLKKKDKKPPNSPS